MEGLKPPPLPFLKEQIQCCSCAYGLSLGNHTPGSPEGSPWVLGDGDRPLPHPSGEIRGCPHLTPVAAAGSYWLTSMHSTAHTISRLVRTLTTSGAQVLLRNRRLLSLNHPIPPCADAKQVIVSSLILPALEWSKPAASKLPLVLASLR